MPRRTASEKKSAGVRDRNDRSDPTESYFQEITHIPLLSSSEEKELTGALFEIRQEIRELLLLSRGVKEIFLQANSSHLLDPQKRKEYLALFRHSALAEGVKKEELLRLNRLERIEHELSSRLFEANVRLVISVARRYRSVGMEMIDLIQEGNTSLLRAVELFDPTLGYRFSTYATYWIKQGITRGIADKATMIRIPAKMLSIVRQIRRTAFRLEQDLQRRPTQEELMKETGHSADRVRQAMHNSFEVVSIETLLGESGTFRLEETLQTDTANPEESFGGDELKETLRKALLHLSPREISLLRTRFGLDDGQFRTLEETGAIHDISRERARLIERSALRKLRRKQCTTLLHRGELFGGGAA